MPESALSSSKRQSQLGKNLLGVLPQLRHWSHGEPCLPGGNRRDQAADVTDRRLHVTPPVPCGQLRVGGEPVHVAQFSIGDGCRVEPFNDQTSGKGPQNVVNFAVEIVTVVNPGAVAQES